MRRALLVVGILICAAITPVPLAGAASPGGASPAAGSSAAAHSAVGKERAGWAGTVRSQAKLKDKVGDKDNFGYGAGTGAPPCAFYDNREPEDEGVFDYEPNGGGDENDSWTHNFGAVGSPTKVKVMFNQIFVDPASPATLEIDGVVRSFAGEPTAVCGGYPENGVKHVFTLTGADAAVAADGSVTITLHENGDDISVDRSTLIVKS